jgi:hypothetical protein
MNSLFNINTNNVGELKLVEHLDKVSNEFLELYKYAYHPEMKKCIETYYKIAFNFVDEWKYMYG